ncbi:MAG: amidohydrolase [Puniceicoccaceae bacterium]|nr:MAG: amidohydrolase [Puniceicoccaceae bacterium]
MAKTQRIIDCDVHQTWADPNELYKRLPVGMQQAKLSIPSGTHGSPVGVMRGDTKPDQGGPGSSPELMISQHVEPFGIEKVVLTGSGVLGLGVHPNVHFATAMARAYNDALVETWLAGDPRFFGSLIVAPQDPVAAAAEIRRMGNHPRIVQVLMTSSTRIPYGQKIYWPIYEAAEEMGLPVAVHPGAEGRGIANDFATGQPSSYCEWHTNIPQNYMGQVVSLILEGVFERFPKLKFVCVEGGLAWIPHVMWRLDKNWKALRSSVPWVKRLPSEYLVEHVRFTTQPIEEPENPDHIRQILEMIHADKTVMFSSDYPHWDNDSPKHAFPKLDDALAARIFHGNAEELYDFSRGEAAAPVNTQ